VGEYLGYLINHWTPVLGVLDIDKVAFGELKTSQHQDRDLVDAILSSATVSVPDS